MPGKRSGTTSRKYKEELVGSAGFEPATYRV
jgi:hypothetical protein